MLSLIAKTWTGIEAAQIRAAPRKERRARARHHPPRKRRRDRRARQSGSRRENATSQDPSSMLPPRRPAARESREEPCRVGVAVAVKERVTELRATVPNQREIPSASQPPAIAKARIAASANCFSRRDAGATSRSVRDRQMPPMSANRRRKPGERNRSAEFAMVSGPVSSDRSQVLCAICGV
jgi:hypothetical protein